MKKILGPLLMLVLLNLSYARTDYSPKEYDVLTGATNISGGGSHTGFNLIDSIKYNMPFSKIKELVLSGSSVNAIGDQRKSVLTIAIESDAVEKYEIATLLLDYGARYNTFDSHGYTPLHAAVYEGEASIMRELLSRGARTDFKNIGGQTPLHLAIQMVLNPSYKSSNERVLLKYIRMIKSLVRHGSDLTIKNSYGMNAIDYAKSFSNDKYNESIQQILKK